MTPRAVQFPIAAAFAALMCLPAGAQSDNPRIGPGIVDFVYGAYCAQRPEREDPAPETASGTINIVPSIPDFRFRTKLIPAEIGIGFGVLATAPAGMLHDPVTVTVTHPPYAATGITVERWETDIDDLAPSLMGFSFDAPEELLLGAWTFSAATASGEELFHIAFEVVAPDLMPQILSACFDSFLS